MAVILISLALLLLLRVPIGFCLMLSGIFYIVYVSDLPWAIMTQRLVAGLDCFTLMAVPFFILAGKFMNEAKITDRLFNFCPRAGGTHPRRPGTRQYCGQYIFCRLVGRCRGGRRRTRFH